MKQYGWPKDYSKTYPFHLQRKGKLICLFVEHINVLCTYSIYSSSPRVRFLVFNVGVVSIFEMHVFELYIHLYNMIFLTHFTVIIVTNLIKLIYKIMVWGVTHSTIFYRARFNFSWFDIHFFKINKHAVLAYSPFCRTHLFFSRLAVTS